MTSNTKIQFDKIKFEKLSATQIGLSSFKCSKDKFAEYLRVGSLYDQKYRIGQTWLCIYEGKIIGFVTIAMAHLDPDDHEDLAIDTFGNIPSLLISHLATHKDYERMGVGKHMVWWVTGKALEFSESMGCRTVMLNPEPDVIEFYKKLDFKYTSQKNKNSDVMFIILE